VLRYKWADLRSRQRRHGAQGSRSLRKLVRVSETPSSDGVLEQGRVRLVVSATVNVLRCLTGEHPWFGSPLRREDLRSIVRRPERVMGILRKVYERGHVPKTSATRQSHTQPQYVATELPLR
jgi:hypothetical protein